VLHRLGQSSFDTLDGNGHGTHVAAIIAGGVAGSEYLGMAPDAQLIGFKVLRDSGDGEDAFIIKALDKVAEINEKAGRLAAMGAPRVIGIAVEQGLQFVVARIECDYRRPARLDDVVALAEPTLKHRMALSFAARAEGQDLSTLIARLAKAVE
jgi:subtilisin family serine protease